MNIHAYLYVQICIYVCMYTYVYYMHTHTHTHLWCRSLVMASRTATRLCFLLLLCTCVAYHSSCYSQVQTGPKRAADRNCYGFILRRQKEKGRLPSLPLKMPPRGSTPLLFTSPQEESSYLIPQLQARRTETSVYSEWSPHPANITGSLHC